MKVCDIQNVDVIEREKRRGKFCLSDMKSQKSEIKILYFVLFLQN